MTRSHHSEFVHTALREAFFADPQGVLIALTKRGEQPLIELWDKISMAMEPHGGERHRASDLGVDLINVSHDVACVLVTLPKPTEPAEAYFVALIANAASFRYLTLEKPTILASGADPEQGHLCEWTAEGMHLESMMPVLPLASEFIGAALLHLSGTARAVPAQTRSVAPSVWMRSPSADVNGRRHSAPQYSH